MAIAMAMMSTGAPENSATMPLIENSAATESSPIAVPQAITSIARPLRRSIVTAALRR
jgi:hypothetical protein